MKQLAAAIIALAVFEHAVPAQQKSPLEQYGELQFPAEPVDSKPGWESVEPGWQERVALEFEIINKASLEVLRAGLTHENKLVRAMAARSLGIRGDRNSAQMLAELARHDPEFLVRIRAVESLGLLKMKPDVIAAVRQDKHAAVSWAADLAADQFSSDLDCAQQIRQAFAAGIERKEMATARVGQPAPDFTALTLDGRTFRLSSVLGKKPIALYFAAFDQ